jgi:DNA-binding response OmpR family regulator
LRFSPYTMHTYYRPGGTLGSRGICLVIEDDRDIRDLVALILTRLGFDVQAVSNGVDGVAAAWEHHPVLVTVDLNLPDMDGLEVAQHIRARSEAPMLFITARAELDDEMAGMASGAAAYLVKPFRPRQLTETVNRLCPVGPLTAHGLERRV